MHVVNANDLPIGGLRCRQIEQADIDAVATLLAEGFPVRTRQFWLNALAQLTRREPPAGLPKYGYLLESQGAVVGAILVICSTIPANDTVAARCNLSSWYVEARFRAYAPLLVSQALRHKDVTYTNVSSAPHTRPIIEAQGFSRYSEGIFVAVPALQGPIGNRRSRFSTQAGSRRSTLTPATRRFCSSTRRTAASACGARPPNAPIRLCFGHAGQKFRTLRATDLLPRRRRLCAFRRTNRPRAGAARPAASS